VHEAEPIAAAEPLGAERRHHEQPPPRGRPLEQLLERRAQARHALALLDPEDRPHDHVERDRLGARPGRDGRPERPARQLGLRDRLHLLAVALQALAVEGGQHQLALAHVALLVEQQDRRGAQDRLEDHVGLAGVQPLRAAGEDRLHVVGVADEHQRPDAGEPDREHAAVAAPQLLHHLGRPQDPGGALGRDRQSRPRGEGRLPSHPPPWPSAGRR
jgi:hypothetical protein